MGKGETEFLYQVLFPPYSLIYTVSDPEGGASCKVGEDTGNTGNTGNNKLIEIGEIWGEHKIGEFT